MRPSRRPFEATSREIGLGPGLAYPYRISDCPLLCEAWLASDGNCIPGHLFEGADRCQSEMFAGLGLALVMLAMPEVHTASGSTSIYRTGCVRCSACRQRGCRAVAGGVSG